MPQPIYRVTSRFFPDNGDPGTQFLVHEPQPTLQQFSCQCGHRVPPPVESQASDRLLNMVVYDSREVRQEHLHLIQHSPGYASFFVSYLDRYQQLLDLKPILIQGALCLIACVGPC